MAAARTIYLNLRYSVQRAGVFARIKLIQHPNACFFRKGQILTNVSGTALLCWTAVSSTSSMARCQEATLMPSIIDKKPAVAKVQVHKLVFFLRLSLRALVLLLKFGPLLFLSPLMLLSSRFTSRWLDALLWVTESSGPAFIKLGQWASTRQDIFSQDFCRRFSRLHVEVHPHSWAYTKQCLRRAFGDAWRNLFVFEGKKPVGSGCVAQVYRGWARVEAVEDPAFQTLVDEMEKEDLLEAWEIPGLAGVASSLWGLWKREREEAVQEEIDQSEKEHLIPVAIKVHGMRLKRITAKTEQNYPAKFTQKKNQDFLQLPGVLHPGMRRQVEIDLLLMRAGAWLLHHLPGLKWLSLPEVVEEFEKLMTNQIDLRFEARNIEKFRENFRGVDFVTFPTPLRPFVTRTILVETFEESEPISNYLRPGVPEEVKQRIARMGIETLLKMVFVDNFVHGDLHPGNILVQRHSLISTEPLGKVTLTDLWDTVVVSMRPEPPPIQLVLLDAGIVAQLSEGDLANFKAVFTAVVERQGARVAELILNHARANECQDVPRFKQEMAELVDSTLRNTLSLGKIQVAELLSRVFGLLITHKVKLESNFASIVFAIMVLEGLGRSLDPNVDILELAKPILLKNCAKLL